MTIASVGLTTSNYQDFALSSLKTQASGHLMIGYSVRMRTQSLLSSYVMICLFGWDEKSYSHSYGGLLNY